MVANQTQTSAAVPGQTQTKATVAQQPPDPFDLCATNSRSCIWLACCSLAMGVENRKTDKLEDSLRDFIRESIGKRIEPDDNAVSVPVKQVLTDGAPLKRCR